jgi:SulP family sulfate permease
MRRGDLANELYFIESGQVSAQIVGADGQALRLESMRGGRIVGELGFYRGSPRTADVVVDEPGVVYRLTRDDLRRMEQADAEAAATLHEIVARLLAERVVHLVTTVEALQR